jgi:putative phage-type endonuclease
MPIETWPITSREEWLERRKQDVTASTAGALLGLHPYCTPLQLYLDKTGIAPMDNGDNPAMRRGRLLEPVAVRIVQEEHPEWRVEAPGLYLRDPAKRIGATPDMAVRDEDDASGVIEIKSVEQSTFRRNWLDENGEIQVPLWIAIQALVCAHLMGAQWALVGVLRVSHGIEFDLLPVPQTPSLIDRIEAAATEFWACVEQQQPPPPVFPADIDAVLRYTKGLDVSDDAVVLPEGDNYWRERLGEYVRVGAEIKEREALCKVIKAETLHKLGPATKLVQDGQVLATAKLVEKKAETKPRAGYTYRDLRIPAGAVTP